MPSVVDARAFFEALYAPVGAGYVEIRPLLDGSDPRRHTEEGMRLEARARRWFLWPREADACMKHCASLDGLFHVYFGVSLRKGDGGGRKADVGCATAVFADVDFQDVPRDAAHAALKAFPLAPSVCVRSGNGVHVYWFLSEPVFESRFVELERVNRAALVQAGARTGPQNVDRLLRVPGTANIKAAYPAPKPVAEVSWWRPETRHRLEDFTTAFPAPPLSERSAPLQPENCPFVLRSLEVPESSLRKTAQILSEVWVPGFRHYLALHVGGWCAHAGFNSDSALRLMEMICEIAGDEEERDRLEAVRDSYRKSAAGEKVAGFTALLALVKDSFPQAFASRAAAVLEAARAGAPAGRPPVLVVSEGGDLTVAP